LAPDQAHSLAVVGLVRFSPNNRVLVGSPDKGVKAGRSGSPDMRGGIQPLWDCCTAMGDEVVDRLVVDLRPVRLRNVASEQAKQSSQDDCSYSPDRPRMQGSGQMSGPRPFCPTV